MVFYILVFTMLIRSQLKLLLWKNFKYRSQKKILLLLELLWPIFIILILIGIRNFTNPYKQAECHFYNRPLPSAGMLPWIQGIICNMDNQCYINQTEGETSGQVDNFSQTIIARFLSDVRNIFAVTDNQTVFSSIDDVSRLLRIIAAKQNAWTNLAVREYLRPNETFSSFLRTILPAWSVDQLLKAKLNFAELMLKQAGTPLTSIVCNNALLGRYLQVEDASSFTPLQKDLCAVPPDKLNQAQQLFISQMDLKNIYTMEQLQSSLTELKQLMKAISFLSEKIFPPNSNNTSRPASILELSKELKTVVPGNGSQMLAKYFITFRKILCGPPRTDGRRIVSVKMYQDEDVTKLVKTSRFKKTDLTSYTSITPFCKRLINDLDTSPSMHGLWRIIKLFFHGKLLYTPDTPVTRQIMKEVNKTFEEMENVQLMADSLEEMGPVIRSFMESNLDIRLLQELLKRPVVAYMVNQQLQNTFWTASDIVNFLSMPDPNIKMEKDAPLTWLVLYENMRGFLRILSEVTKCFSIQKKLEGITTEVEMVKRALSLVGNRQFWAGIVFLFPDNSLELPPHVKYKIRMDTNDVKLTDKIENKIWIPGPAADAVKDLGYVTGGFVYVQDLVEQAITRIHSGTPSTTGVYLQQMPYPCYVNDFFTYVFGLFFPLFMTLVWVFSLATIIKSVVHEKEARLKETMRIMGLKSFTLWLSWFISSYLVYLVICLLLAILIKFGGVLPYCNPLVVFFYLVAYSLATTMLSFLFSTFFSRANLAAACGSLLFLTLFLPYMLFMTNDDLDTTYKIIASFLSPVAGAFGYKYLAQFEVQGDGAQWYNIMSNPDKEDGYNIVFSIIMLLVDSFIYAVASLYIEAVFPGQYGIPKPWNFLFQRNFWKRSPPKAESPSHDLENEDALTAGLIEPEPAGVAPGVVISKLVKCYEKGGKFAVDNLSVKFFEGQITSFLGHNGAGKTTTMSIMTGLFPPTSGTVYFKGKDIQRDINEIRKYLGICPQHNILFDNLTVEEHMYFYSGLKGTSNAELGEEINVLLADVGLLEVRDELSKNLSGGMKRKLSVAIAFIGGSKVVILDEPTAGVDPYSRRAIWDMLLKHRKDCTIILCTQYMDEADLLADRIAIISQGKLCCCGSSLFLKSQLGSGYYLTVVKESQFQDIDSLMTDDTGLDSEVQGSAPASDINSLMALAKNSIPGSKLVTDSGREAVINLPHSSSKDGTLALFLAELDRCKDKFGIVEYGLSGSTLEEVFLKVTENTGLHRETNEEATQPGEHSDQQRKPPKDTDIEAQEEESPNRDNVCDTLLTGCSLTGQQCRALFTKRLLYIIRSRRAFFLEIVLPAVFIMISLLFNFILPSLWTYSDLKLEPNMYGKQIAFISNDAPDDPVMQNLFQAFLEPPGFGTICMDPDMKLQCKELENRTVFSQSKMPYSVWKKLNSDKPSLECQCSNDEFQIMLPSCPEEAGGPPPPQAIIPTDIVLQDLTGYNISDFLVKTYSKLIEESRKTGYLIHESRYGGFSLGGKRTQNKMRDIKDGVVTIRKRHEIKKNSATDKFLDKLPDLLAEKKQNVKVWFNNKGWHAIVSFVNVMNNGLLRAILPLKVNRRNYGITAYNHPLNLTKEQLTDVALIATTIDVLVSICVIFALSMVPASFVLFLIEERVSKAKHLQFVSGLQPILYWTASFAWDMLNYAVPATLVMLILLISQKEAYVSAGNFPGVALLLFFYGWAITPMMYPASFLFSVPSMAYVILTCINLFIGFNASLTTFLLDLLPNKKVKDINNFLNNFFLIFPHFCLGRGLIDMAKSRSMTEVFNKFGTLKTNHSLEWDFVGKYLFAMVLQGTFCFIFTILLQYRFFIGYSTWFKPELPPLGLEDEDVAKEREKVMSGQTQNVILTLIELSKVYKARKKPAVDRLCLEIPQGECFGLLGINGAGKTSTFSMLTGDIPITYGDAFVCNHSVKNEIKKVHQLIGYCPQFDAINGLLTAKEHLVFYARLKGIPEPHVLKVAQWGIRTLDLLQYADRIADSYSGGNKRKLSTAIALIGASPLIFLDEPTTGMDPKCKRFLWNCLRDVIKKGQSVVLTSHSMEECEALCTRIAIMVNGRFQCLGSVQHLKSRFGDGYTIILRLSTPSDPFLVDAFIQKSFPGIELQEKHNNVLQYQLPTRACCLSRVFRILSDNHEQLEIADYSVAQTTLDEVFISFVKEQTDGHQLRLQPPSRFTSLTRFSLPLMGKSSQPRIGALKTKGGKKAGQFQDIEMRPFSESAVSRPKQKKGKSTRADIEDPNKLFLEKSDINEDKM